MELTEFHKIINENPQPIIVDLWAPWCGPCRAMEPFLKNVSQKYAGQVGVIKVNADDSIEVMKSLGVLGIPTVIGFASGKEIVRRTGTCSSETLDILFDATLHQRKPEIIPLAPIDRLIRSVVGLGLALYGWFSGPSILWIGLGAIVLFSAFYDRCPVYRAVISRLKALLRRSHSHP